MLVRKGKIPEFTEDSGDIFESEIEGGALWLPNCTVVQITMGPSSCGQEDSVIEITVIWGVKKDLLLGMTRQYSTEGEFLRAISSTWSRPK